MTDEERVRLVARQDFPWYAKSFLNVVERQEFVPFQLRPMQQRLWDKLETQRAAGRPGRVLVLKARKMGASTMAQGLLLQRASLRPNHNSVTVAQDNKTAAELFAVAEQMYHRLPVGEGLEWCKPPIKNRRRGRELFFGGGLESRVFADTARELEAGRGFTFHTLHLSEVAFWRDVQRKLTALVNTVPQDDPDTLVLIESTANGFDYFQKMWVQAECGENEYEAFFAGWQEDPRYARPFTDAAARTEFESDVGRGPWGSDEPEFLRRGFTLEQLHWRRWAIENLAHGDLDTFRQEYPSTPDEAFIGTGRTVFAANHIRRVREIAEKTDPAALRLWLTAKDTTTRVVRSGTTTIPTSVATREWKDTDRGDEFWKVWRQPGDEGTSGHFIVVVDPAAGAENTAGESDYTGIQVMDWKTREQCAEFRSYCEPAVSAEQAFLAALLYRHDKNLPLVVVEITGGYGNWIAQRVWREMGWRNMYFRKSIDPRQKELQSDLVGFMTDRGSKPMLVDTGRDLLTENDPGIRSLKLADELRTYIRDKKGRTGAEDGSHDDLLMPWLIGQYIAGVKPPRERRAGGIISTRQYERKLTRI